MNDHFLDLRGVACPMNFVKTKLYLDKLNSNEILQVLLDSGEPVESVCQSVQADGNQITECSQMPEGHYKVVIVKR